MKHRYKQEALAAVPGAEARSYSPKEGPQPAPPEQGWLALDGGALGPLFNRAKEVS